MACEIERPSPSELFAKYRNMFQNTVLGGATIIPESNEWYATSMNYAMAEEFYAIADQAWKERDPATACADNLYAMAARDGMYRRPAQPAQGYVQLTGTPGAALPASMEFTIGGADFISVGTQPSNIGTDGKATVRVRAVLAGVIEGGLTVATGTMTTVVANVQPTVQVQGCAMCWGSAEETTEQFRQRYLDRLQYQPRADAAWLVDKFMDWPCVTRAARQEGSCCGCNCRGETVGGGDNDCSECGCVDCGGKNNYYVFMDTSFANGIIPETVRKEIEDWMFGSPQGYGLGQVPIGICGSVKLVDPVQINISVDVDGCPSPKVLQGVRDIITEYFTTIEPSKTASVITLQASIDRAYPEIQADVTWLLEDSTLAYGHGYGPAVEGVTKVYFGGGGCSAEPDCDVLLVLGDITFTPGTEESGGCA